MDPIVPNARAVRINDVQRVRAREIECARERGHKLAEKLSPHYKRAYGAIDAVRWRPLPPPPSLVSPTNSAALQFSARVISPCDPFAQMNTRPTATPPPICRCIMHVPDQSPGARACVCVYAGRSVARNTPMMCASFMTLADMIIYSQLMLIRLKSYARLRSGTYTGVRVITFSSNATPMDIDIARAT